MRVNAMCISDFVSNGPIACHQCIRKCVFNEHLLVSSLLTPFFFSLSFSLILFWIARTLVILCQNNTPYTIMIQYFTGYALAVLSCSIGVFFFVSVFATFSSPLDIMYSLRFAKDFFFF